MAVSKASKAVKSLIGRINVIWSLSALLINVANK